MSKLTNSNNQILSPSDPEKLLYVGPSMNPTLQNYDIVRFYHSKTSDIRVGDIVVIRLPDNQHKKVIHRVISTHKDRIRTQGDNCRSPDPWISKENVLGIVTQITRNGMEYPLNRDLSRYLLVVFLRIKNWILYEISHLLKYPYDLASSSHILSKYTTRFFLKSVRQFKTKSRSELRVYLGKVVIAHLREGMPGWRIKAPFKILIDETQMPSFNNTPKTSKIFEDTKIER